MAGFAAATSTLWRKRVVEWVPGFAAATSALGRKRVVEWVQGFAAAASALGRKRVVEWVPARGGDSTHESPRTSHPLATTALPDAPSVTAAQRARG